MDTSPGRLQAPYMLDIVVANAQRLAAVLPPNEWNPDAVFFRLRQDARGRFDLVRLPRSHLQRHGRLTQNLTKTSTPNHPGVEEEVAEGSEGRLRRLKYFWELSANGFVGGTRISEHPTAMLKAFRLEVRFVHK
jgi:hypothetical protein